MSIAEVALVACGAALGASARWWVDVSVQRRWLAVFPWGTFAVNLVGSGLLGFLVASWASEGFMVTLLSIGFCAAAALGWWVGG